MATNGLETLALIAGSLEVLLAAMNCRYFGGYALRTRLTSRRAGSWTLALVSGAMTLEAAVYVARTSGFSPGDSLRLLADVLVRTLLLAATALVSLLVLRGRRLLAREARHDRDGPSR